jgi:aminocarboxymuconate-semialdehyde decarboxylase
MERIDAFAHALTERFYDELTANYDFKGLSGSPAWLWDIERFTSDMAELGLDKLVLTLALPPLWRGMDPDDALALTRLANDEIRRLADEHPDHFIPVGTIPFPDDAYRDEFDRCVDDLDMAGVQLFSNVDGDPIDRPRFHWWYAYAERHGVPLWLHPQHHDWYDWASERMDHRLFGWPFDTTLALSRLVFSGLTREYDFDLVTHHGGGMVPFFGSRIDMFYETRLAYPDNYDTELPAFDGEPSDAFRAAFAADTALDGSVEALDCARAFFGSDRVVFGTDYPFGPGRGRAKVEAAMASIDAADLTTAEREGIYADNLRALL